MAPFHIELKPLKEAIPRGPFLPTCYSKLGWESGPAKTEPFISLDGVRFNPDKLPNLVHPTAAETHRLTQGKQAWVQDVR